MGPFLIGSISCKNGKPRQSCGPVSGWKQLPGLAHELGLWTSSSQHFQLCCIRPRWGAVPVCCSSGMYGQQVSCIKSQEYIWECMHDKKILIKFCTTRAPSQMVQAISLLLVLLWSQKGGRRAGITSSEGSTEYECEPRRVPLWNRVLSECDKDEVTHSVASSTPWLQCSLQWCWCLLVPGMPKP